MAIQTEIESLIKVTVDEGIHPRNKLAEEVDNYYYDGCIKSDSIAKISQNLFECIILILYIYHIIILLDGDIFSILPVVCITVITLLWSATIFYGMISRQVSDKAAVMISLLLSPFSGLILFMKYSFIKYNAFPFTFLWNRKLKPHKKEIQERQRLKIYLRIFFLQSIGTMMIAILSADINDTKWITHLIINITFCTLCYSALSSSIYFNQLTLIQGYIVNLLNAFSFAFRVSLFIDHDNIFWNSMYIKFIFCMIDVFIICHGLFWWRKKFLHEYHLVRKCLKKHVYILFGQLLFGLTFLPDTIQHIDGRYDFFLHSNSWVFHYGYANNILQRVSRIKVPGSDNYNLCDSNFVFYRILISWFKLSRNDYRDLNLKIFSTNCIICIHSQSNNEIKNENLMNNMRYANYLTKNQVQFYQRNTVPTYDEYLQEILSYKSIVYHMHSLFPFMLYSLFGVGGKRHAELISLFPFYLEAQLLYPIWYLLKALFLFYPCLIMYRCIINENYWIELNLMSRILLPICILLILCLLLILSLNSHIEQTKWIDNILPTCTINPISSEYELNMRCNQILHCYNQLKLFPKQKSAIIELFGYDVGSVIIRFLCFEYSPVFFDVGSVIISPTSQN